MSQNFWRSVEAEAVSTDRALPPLLALHDRPTCRFFAHQDAVASLRYVSGTKLDERIIRCDLDPGYTENRQYGRGRSGGQVRDEYREDWDGQSLLTISCWARIPSHRLSSEILPNFSPRDPSVLTSHFAKSWCAQLVEAGGVTSRTGKRWKRNGSAKSRTRTGQIMTRAVRGAKSRPERECQTR